MKRKTTEASTIKRAEACGSVRFDVNCSLEEFEKYYRNAGLHYYFRSVGITYVAYGELGQTEERIIKTNPSHHKYLKRKRFCLWDTNHAQGRPATPVEDAEYQNTKRPRLGNTNIALPQAMHQRTIMFQPRKKQRTGCSTPCTTLETKDLHFPRSANT